MLKSAGYRLPQSWLAAIVVFLLSAVLSAALLTELERNRRDRLRDKVSAQAANQAHAVRQQIERSMAVTYTLAALVRHGHGRVRDFELVANELLPYYPSISSLQLLPDGVIQQIEPLAGNEAAIGMNLLENKARNHEALLARDSGQLTLAGPYDLVQGGQGAVARLPVFLNDGDDKIFWGLVAVVMRFPDALVGTGLGSLAKDHGLAYELWRIAPETGQKQVIAATGDIVLVDPVEASVDLALGKWTLSVAPIKGWGDPPGFALQAFLGLLFSLLMASLAKLLVEARAHERGLETEVTARTADLLAAQSQLQATLAAIPDLMFELEADSRILGFHSARAAQLQVSPNEIHGRLLVDFVSAATRPAVEAGIREALTDGYASRIRYEVPLAQGARWYAASIARKEIPGQAPRCIVLARDVTRNKEAEDALRESRESLQRLLDSMTEGAYGVDIAGNCSFVNRAFLEVMGYRDVAEVLGKHVHSLIHHSHADGSPYPASECLMYRAFVAGAAAHVTDEVFWHSSGKAIPVEYWSNPVIDNGKVVGAICTFIDISERRRLAAELDRHRHNLEQLVQERTAELTAARVQADAANQVKTAFLATMSHELRTPLNSILGLCYLVGRELADPKLRAQVDKICSAGQQLLGMVNQILDMSRLEADKLEVENTGFALQPMLDAAANGWRQRAVAKGLGFALEIDPALPQILRGDPPRLGQILEILVDNAIKFSDQGRITLRVRLQETGGERLLLRFEVEDQGIGIEAAQLALLFNSFAQADSSTTRKYGGIGVGLNICRRLALLMGGEVGVDSTPGAGSTFWFTALLQHQNGIVALPAPEHGMPGPYAETAPAQETMAPAADSVRPDAQSLKPMLDQLDVLLAQSDIAAIALFEQHAADLRTSLGAPGERLGQEIRQFAFEAARETLRGLR